MHTTQDTQYAKPAIVPFAMNAPCVRTDTPSTAVLNQEMDTKEQRMPKLNKHSSPKRQRTATPVQPNKLKSLLKGYDPQLTKYITNGFTNGFRIHAENITTYPRTLRNAKIAELHPEAVDNKLQKELQKGTIAGPFINPPFQDMIISPLSLRPKHDNSGWRLLHDLSYPYDETSVNSNIPEEYKHVKYSSIQDAITIIQQIGKSTFMAKSDIASAFTLVPIHPYDHHLLGFQWKKQYYYYTTLPQGAASSCFIFERISTALQWILQERLGVENVVHYLDDFLFLGRTKQQCLHSINIFQELCSQIGIPINHAKTEGPTTSLSFLGIQLDSIAFQAVLPQEKVLKYVNLMQSFLQRKTCTLHEMQQIIGSLQFTTSVVRPGRTFLRRLINATIGVNKPYHHIHLTKSIKDDIQIWIQFLHYFNGTSFFIPTVPIDAAVLNLHTDSCPQGFGGTFKTHYFLGKFPHTWSNFNICVLELYPILLALQLFHKEMSNTNLIIHSDNMAVVAVLTKKTTKQPQMLILLRRLVLHCLKHNILFTSKHISGKLNILPDALSRNTHTLQMLQERSMDTHPTPIPDLLLPSSFKL